MVQDRWSLEQVLAIAPARAAAARPLAIAALWSDTGCDDRAVWGRHVGSRAEPYDVVVDHAPSVGDLRSRCTCPSRVSPCKHAVALLILWSRDDVVPGSPPARVTRWIASRTPASVDVDTDVGRSVDAVAGTSAASGSADGQAAAPRPLDDLSVSDDRMRRLVAGLTELERWIDDRLRVGLGDPSIARYSTWDDLAARLVDAQAGGLANRVRRIAGHVGSGPDWHADVLAELGVLHVLARAGRRLHALDTPWRDSVAAAIGLTVRQADVRAQVPDTATWAVMGRGDSVEDRIVVRRTWLRALGGHGVDRADRGWAMLLDVAAHGQALESAVAPGAVVAADLHRYPGAVALRALLGPVHHDTVSSADTPRVASSTVVEPSPSIAAARAEVGAMLAIEPWLERVPLCVVAAPAPDAVDRRRWVLADHSGALPILATADLTTVLAVSGGSPVTVTCEWTPLGVSPLSVHLDDRLIDMSSRQLQAVER